MTRVHVRLYLLGSTDDRAVIKEDDCTLSTSSIRAGNQLPISEGKRITFEHKGSEFGLIRISLGQLAGFVYILPLLVSVIVCHGI